MRDRGRRRRLLRSVALQNAEQHPAGAPARGGGAAADPGGAAREPGTPDARRWPRAGTGTFRWDLRCRTWSSGTAIWIGCSACELARTAQSLDAFIARRAPRRSPRLCGRAASAARAKAPTSTSSSGSCGPTAASIGSTSKAKTVVDEHGVPLYMTGGCADITIRKQAAEALREKRVNGCAPSSIQAAVGIAVDRAGRPFPRHEPASSPTILGYTYDELCQLTFTDITHPDDCSETGTASRELLAGRDPTTRSRSATCVRTGRAIWMPRHGQPSCATQWRTHRFIGRDRETSLRAGQAEAALRQAAEERKALLESERAARSRGRAHERAEGRVPGDAVARAAHAAQRDPRLGADPAQRPARTRPSCRKGSRPSSATRACRRS